ncbi:hypothetical protein L593_09570 [Salinarchaeum sp. Harcht-Bsk1]|uniref:DUF1508 domain-containing protein n=1 Tax=Salinarchaeum sp. Harcht-Bsk1 TaxID=1333523 RepID=UPI0003423FE2|nr:DUF1508 domain-containing protein [Salinarchaeum sp. Harcht-Bsk1]AGN01859.1 hypothetical protein L593_09570 [Salinarchaeum sp. Harcht-Bsk1]
MAASDIQDGKLVELYHRYVGEPDSKRDVYGYWLFLMGTLAGILGFLIYEVGVVMSGQNWALRRIAIVLAASGGVFGLLGIVTLLPVRRRAMQASLVGAAVALLSMPVFWTVYPGSWNVNQGTDYAPIIIAVYSLGVGVVAGVAVLVPVITGEKGLLVEPELGIDSDASPVLLGEEKEDAFFAVFEHPSNDWAWRIIQRDALGESAELAPSDTDARLAIDDVRETIGDAGMLEITTAAFRLYKTDEGGWRWSLVRDDGSVLARSDEPAATRDEAESTVTFLKEAIPGANVIEIRSAAFDVSEDERGDWHWRLLDDRRQPLATDPGGYDDEAAAEVATDQFVEGIDGSRILAFEVGVELVPGDGGWHWRIVDRDDRALVTSEAAYETRRSAEQAASDAAERVGDATIIQRGQPGYELYAVGDGHRWRLRDDADDLIATSHETVDAAGTIQQRAERTRSVVGDAETVEVEGADYEVYPESNPGVAAGGDDAAEAAGDGGRTWNWRLVSADRRLLADSTESFADSEAAESAASRVREQALAADLIEFEQAAFQQYESGGEWRWRLIDEDGQVMADSGEEYGSREEVMDGMTTLKENAPDAEVLEIDTAAFEIYKTDAGEYAWRLIDEAGKLIAEGAETHPSRASARDAVDFLTENLEDARVRGMETAIFQLSTDVEADVWDWWLVDTDGTILAEGTERYPTRDDAVAAIADVREAGDGAEVDQIGALTLQLRNGGGWHWRLIDRDREAVATGDRTYEDRGSALTDAHAVIDGAADAPVFELGDGVIWVDETDDGWGWRLLDANREPVAVSAERYESQHAAVEAVEDVQSRAPDAGTLEFDTLAFELHRDETDGWAWRLLDERERVRAVSAANYEVRDDVTTAIDESKDVVGQASILEIDEAAFEFHERGGGWIWRLVDENGRSLAESVEPHPSRQAAREEMLSVKEHGPEGETVVTW